MEKKEKEKPNQLGNLWSAKVALRSSSTKCLLKKSEIRQWTMWGTRLNTIKEKDWKKVNNCPDRKRRWIEFAFLVHTTTDLCQMESYWQNLQGLEKNAEGVPSASQLGPRNLKGTGRVEKYHSARKVWAYSFKTLEFLCVRNLHRTGPDGENGNYHRNNWQNTKDLEWVYLNM